MTLYNNRRTMSRLILTIISLCLCASSFAQQQQQQQQEWNPHQGMRQFSPEAFNRKLEEFVKCEAELTPQECKNFFPLMHEMLNKQREINGKIQYTIGRGFKAKTEQDYEEIIAWVTDLEVESKKIEQTYYKKKFHSVLSWKKIHKVRTALQKFNMEALRRFAPQNRGWRQPNENQNNR